MTPRGRVFRSQWIHREQDGKSTLESETMRRARRLPLPGPGIVITLKLDLLPAYLELHKLEPMSRGEVADNERATRCRKPAGVLYVKRLEREGKHLHLREVQV